MRIENAKSHLDVLPVNFELVRSLRELARLQSTHFSTKIEGNRLNQQEVKQLLEHKGHFPGRERDEKEVMGYYAALEQIEMWVKNQEPITANRIKKLHSLVMGGGKKRVKSSPFREGQNAIYDGSNGSIVYMPPEAKDVAPLIDEMLVWLKTSDAPEPVKAGLIHYQFATIHPYYDGNGRCSRLLTALVLHLGGYGLRGLFCLEEYYARDLQNYYKAIAVGPSHNYYMGRAEADITGWLEYFCAGMAHSFEAILQKAKKCAASDESTILRSLDPKKRKFLSLVDRSAEFTSSDVAQIFQISPRTARNLCQRWCEEDFIHMTQSAKKIRKYRVS